MERVEGGNCHLSSFHLDLPLHSRQSRVNEFRHVYALWPIERLSGGEFRRDFTYPKGLERASLLG